MTFIAPRVLLQSFTCPHCRAITRHYWWGYADTVNANHLNEASLNVPGANVPIRMSRCEHCEGICYWHLDDLVFPLTSSAPPPNAHMPDDVLADYDEAAQILPYSPRGSAALLRLAIQKLCEQLGQSGKDLNTDIAALVKQGLPQLVKQSLDVVRVTGNNAVHPGHIDVNDKEIAVKLFPLVNIIVEYLIEMPEKVQALHGELPEKAIEQIDKRDGAQN